jgi:hypothetical protein
MQVAIQKIAHVPDAAIAESLAVNVSIDGEEQTFNCSPFDISNIYTFRYTVLGKLGILLNVNMRAEAMFPKLVLAAWGGPVADLSEAALEIPQVGPPPAEGPSKFTFSGQSAPWGECR